MTEEERKQLIDKLRRELQGLTDEEFMLVLGGKDCEIP